MFIAVEQVKRRRRCLRGQEPDDMTSIAPWTPGRRLPRHLAPGEQTHRRIVDGRTVRSIRPLAVLAFSLSSQSRGVPGERWFQEVKVVVQIGENTVSDLVGLEPLVGWSIGPLSAVAELR